MRGSACRTISYGRKQEKLSQPRIRRRTHRPDAAEFGLLIVSPDRQATACTLPGSPLAPCHIS
jgi:hypothetical protein